MSKQLLSRISIFCAFLALSGCHSSGSGDQADPNVPPPPEGVRVQVVQDASLRLTTPTVDFDDGIMTVSGYVRRKPGVRGVITGRIDIDVVDADGNSLDWIPALLTPGSVPTEGRGESGYIIHYGWIPPAGSIIKVRFADTKTANIEDNTDDETVGGRYGTHTGGHAGSHGRGHGGGMRHM